MFDHQMFTTQRKPPGSCDPEYAIMQSTQSWTYYHTNSNPWSNVNKKQIQTQRQIHYEYMQSCKAPNIEYLNAFCYKFRYIVVQSPRNTKTYKYGFIHTFCAFIYVWSECFHFDLVFFRRKLSQVAIVHCHVHQTRKWKFRKIIANDILYSEWHPGTSCLSLFDILVENTLKHRSSTSDVNQKLKDSVKNQYWVKIHRNY